MRNYSLYNKEWLESSYQPRVRAYYYKEWNDFHMSAHVHNMAEIMYVVHGKCAVKVENETFFLKNGDMIFIDANISHALSVEKNDLCRMLEIEFDFEEHRNSGFLFKDFALKSEYISFLIKQRKKYILLKDNDEVYPLLKSLVFELDRKTQDCELMEQLLLMQILIKFARCFSEADKNDCSNGIVHVRKAIKFIHSNYDKEINVHVLASIVRLNPSYFQRIFKLNTGKTVIEYLTELRIEKSKMLLINTEILVTEIPTYIGINSSQYFSAVFKKCTGLTPVEFRVKNAKDFIILTKK